MNSLNNQIFAKLVSAVPYNATIQFEGEKGFNQIYIQFSFYNTIHK